jgi:hypothetical protein
MKNAWIWVELMPLVVGIGLVGSFMAALILFPY